MQNVSLFVEIAIFISKVNVNWYLYVCSVNIGFWGFLYIVDRSIIYVFLRIEFAKIL